MTDAESRVVETLARSSALDRGKSAPTWTAVLRRRVLDLVVIGWVAAVGLTTGRQLVDWWREDASATPSIVGDAGEDWSRRPVDVRVGPRGVPLYRSPFVGDREAVEQRLMQLVQSRLSDTPVPTARPDESEQQLLDRLKTEPPIATDHGRGVLYRWSAPWPGMIGTIFVEQQERLAVHGFAVPAGENKWTTFILSPLALSGSRNSPTTLPPRVIPLLSWTDEAGRQVATFRGPGVLAEWIAFFDQRYRTATSTVRAVTSDSATLQYRHDKHVIDVQIQTAENGQLTGVMWTVPLSPPDALQSLPTDPLKNHPAVPP
ncbi:MAG TPA: hypothetical protein VFG20_20355 [Planctomycetaceae bacterium]|nr:hypothetical protein [Planctomycetaceae bacterium]